MNIQFFPSTLTTEDQIKAYYKVLAKFYHPDMPGGDSEIMQRINEEFAALEQNGFQPVQAPKLSSPPKRNISIKVGLNGKEYDINNKDHQEEILTNLLINLFKKNNHE